MNGDYIKGFLMKFKVFQDKGREYYNIIAALISLAVVVGVWLPYIQEGLLLIGIPVPKIVLSAILMGASFIFVNVFLTWIGWVTYNKNITQQELVYRDLQHPWNIVGMMGWRRILTSFDILSEALEESLEPNKRLEFKKKWDKMKKNMPMQLKVGNRVLADFHTLSKEELEELVEKLKTMEG